MTLLFNSSLNKRHIQNLVYSYLTLIDKLDCEYITYNNLKELEGVFKITVDRIKQLKRELEDNEIFRFEKIEGSLKALKLGNGGFEMVKHILKEVKFNKEENQNGIIG